MTFQEAFDLMQKGSTVYRYGPNNIMTTCRIYEESFIINYHIPSLSGPRPGTISPDDILATNWQEVR